MIAEYIAPDQTRQTIPSIDVSPDDRTPLRVWILRNRKHELRLIYAGYPLTAFIWGEKVRSFVEIPAVVLPTTARCDLKVDLLSLVQPHISDKEVVG